jgi:hypothetical protein
LYLEVESRALTAEPKIVAPSSSETGASSEGRRNLHNSDGLREQLLVQLNCVAVYCFVVAAPLAFYSPIEFGWLAGAGAEQPGSRQMPESMIGTQAKQCRRGARAAHSCRSSSSGGGGSSGARSAGAARRIPAPNDSGPQAGHGCPYVSSESFLHRSAVGACLMRGKLAPARQMTTQ